MRNCKNSPFPPSPKVNAQIEKGFSQASDFMTLHPIEQVQNQDIQIQHPIQIQTHNPPHTNLQYLEHLEQK